MLVVMAEDGGWVGFGWQDWADLGKVRARLASGADPNTGGGWLGPPLRMAVEYGSAEVVAELAARVDDVDAVSDGRTALWAAVAANRPDNARVLVAAGADPWREMMSGWPPGRLSLASPTPGLLGSGASLSPEEIAAVAESRRLLTVVGGVDVEGLGIACVADIDVGEAVRRLAAEVVDGDGEEMLALWRADPLDFDLLTMWVTGVPGGCVIAQPWAYGPQMPGVTERLSGGTTCYGMYANPKSGNQGSITRDGEIVGWDLHPGGGPDQQGDVLLSYLYQNEALAYCLAYAGLCPVDARAVSGPPDVWVRLPDRDYWS
jgi:hypothetical protein